jgi:hypothetical protein
MTTATPAARTRKRRPAAQLRRTLIWGYGTPEELDAVCSAARQQGVSVSSFVRDAVLRAIDGCRAQQDPHYTKPPAA